MNTTKSKTRKLSIVSALPEIKRTKPKARKPKAPGRPAKYAKAARIARRNPGQYVLADVAPKGDVKAVNNIRQSSNRVSAGYSKQMAGLKSSTRTVGNEVRLYIWEPKAEPDVSMAEIHEAQILLSTMSGEQLEFLLSTL